MSSIFDGIGDEGVEQLDENLRKWFKEKWVRFGPDGKIRGSCARGSESEGKPKCLPQKKAHSLGKKGRASAASRKRREDPNPERRGKAKNVATKKKSNEDIQVNEKWSQKYKDSINCSNPKGFSQKAHCAGKKKNEDMHEETKKCPECGGPMYHESMMTEKKDACYHKVKSRYKVWPSAYASGALVQCRKKGASNWGTGGKKNESNIMKGIVDENAAPKLVQISKPVTQGPIDDPWMGINVITKYKVGDKVYSVLSFKQLEQEDVYGTFIFDNTDPKNHMDNVAEIDIYGNRVIFDKNHTGAPKDVWYQLPENIAMALHNASFPEAKKLLDAQPMPDEDNVYEGVIIGHDKDDPQVAVLGGAGSYSLSNLKKKAQMEANELAKDVSEGKFKNSAYTVKQLANTLNTIVAAEEEMEKLYFGEDYTGEFAAEVTPAINPYGGLKDRKHRGAISETPTDNPTGASGEGGWRRTNIEEEQLDEKCWKGYKKQGTKKMFGKTYPNCVKNTNEEEQLDEKCWDTHKQVGMKNKGGRQVPNCVPKESAIMRGLKRENK